MRRHLTFVILGVLAAAGAIAAAPAFLTSSVPLPAGAVARATATPPAQAQSSAPPIPSPILSAIPSPIASAAPLTDPGKPPDSLGRQAPFDAPNPALLTGYVWPLPRGRITNPFGPDWYSDNTVGGVRFHDGLDLATFCGDRIVAAHDGVVLAAGRKVDPWMGWIGSLAPSVARRDKYQLWGELPIVIVIDDGNGYRSIYAHFSKIAVRAGQAIRAGEFLGWEGRTGFATGCHLHYGLFSPYATDRFGLRADVVQRTKLPALEIARINPLLVLPPRPTPGSSPAPGPSQVSSSSPNPASGSAVDPLVAPPDERPGRQPAK